MKLIHLLIDQDSVLTLGYTVEYCVYHQCNTDQDTGKDTAEEQVTGGNTSRQGIQYEGDGRRDNYTQTAGNRDHTSAPCLVITHADHERNYHGTYSCGRCRTGTGNCTVEQTGQDCRTGHTAGDSAYEISKEVKQSSGDTTLCHDNAAKDEQRNCQNGGGVRSGESIV